MAATIERTIGNSIRVKSPEELMDEMLTEVSLRGIGALAVTRKQSVSGEELAEQLGIGKVIVCKDLDEVIEASKRLHDNHAVAGGIEIERPGRGVPEFPIGGQKLDILGLLRRLGPDSRMGRVDILTEDGLSSNALFSTEQRDPIVRDVVREGGDPTATMIARPYDRLRLV